MPGVDSVMIRGVTVASPLTRYLSGGPGGQEGRRRRVRKGCESRYFRHFWLAAAVYVASCILTPLLTRNRPDSISTLIFRFRLISYQLLPDSECW